MPKSKIFLPDVNVWLALASTRHAHSQTSTSWLNSVEHAEIAFCRVTQMGLLRLLTNESVMASDVLTSRDSWRIYETILSDERVQFADEPPALEKEWKALTTQSKSATKLWTDAYLVAFARSAGMQLVTLDRGAASIAAEALLLK